MTLIFDHRFGENRRPMITALLHLLRLCPFLLGGHRQLALENIALRQQLAVYKRAANRPKLRRTGRLFGVVGIPVNVGTMEGAITVGGRHHRPAAGESAARAGG